MKVVRWKQIDWEQVNTYINRLQMRIVKAVQENKWRLVKRLRYLITHSFYGKALAIKRVISNKGKKTPGIDGIVWKSDKDKEKAIQELQLEGYRAKPLRRIYIEKFGKKEKRPLGIPTMKDRAMQALQLLGLEPIAETMADTVSFGFRKFRSAQDAMEYSFSILCRKDSPQWILEGDIKGCFESEEKTKITSIQEGYDFLGWNFRKYRGKMIIKPSNKSVHKVRMTISNTIRNNKTSTQANLIYQLNQVMRGWAEYHHSVCSKEIFGKIDHTTWEMLWHWAKRRHPNKSKNWIVNRYWKIHKGRAWSFISNENVLFYMSDMPIVRHSQLRLQANPFLDTDYFEQRKRTIEMKRIRAMSSNKAAHIGYYAL